VTSAVVHRHPNGTAIASVVLGVVWIFGVGSVLAIVTGHVARYQLRRDPTERGRGPALVGLLFGYLGLLLAIAYFTLAVLLNNDA
jgi:threonine/homoserine/homoserine lactone efflux protein